MLNCRIPRTAASTPTAPAKRGVLRPKGREEEQAIKREGKNKVDTERIKTEKRERKLRERKRKE